MPRLVSAKVISWFLLLAVLDGAVMPAFQIRAVYPSLLCLFVCYASFQWGASKTVFVAFWAGLLRDLLGGGSIGLEATLMVLLALLLDFLVQKMERQLTWIYYVITFLFVFFAGVLSFLLTSAGKLPATSVGGYFGIIAMNALYTSALLPFFNFFANGWFGRSSGKQYELFR